MRDLSHFTKTYNAVEINRDNHLKGLDFSLKEGDMHDPDFERSVIIEIAVALRESRSKFFTFESSSYVDDIVKKHGSLFSQYLRIIETGNRSRSIKYFKITTALDDGRFSLFSRG